MQKKFKIFLVVIAAIILCVPAQAQDYLSIEEAIDIILDYHNIETDITGIADYLTLDTENVVMNREIAVTAIVRSFGIYPANELNHVWADEMEQDQQYQSYIDYALRTGITKGTGNNYFAPKHPITEKELRIMLERAILLERANKIEPVYKLSYDSALSKLLSADIQYGIYKTPDYLVDSFYKEGRKITVTDYPLNINGKILSSNCVGYIFYEGNMWITPIYKNCFYFESDIAVIHEFGHYLEYRTKSISRHSVKDELDWMINTFTDYCDTDNHEFFAESFATYIVWPGAMKENMPITYQHIENCLEIMKNKYNIT